MQTPLFYGNFDARQRPGSAGIVYEVTGLHLDVLYSLTIQVEGPPIDTLAQQAMLIAGTINDENRA